MYRPQSEKAFTSPIYLSTPSYSSDMEKLGRRKFLVAAGAALAGAGRLRAQATTRIVQTPVLSIAYEEGGPQQGLRSSSCMAFQMMCVASMEWRRRW